MEIRRFIAAGGLVIAMLILVGCPPSGHVGAFARPIELPADGVARVLGYDLNGDGRVDYRQRLDGGGRVAVLEYDTTGDGQFDECIELAGLDHADSPHFVILLDGPPWELVAAMQREGRFRLFGPASRTISVFPAMTDLAFNELLGTGPSPGFEGRYFDRAANRVAGGTADYLALINAPWAGRLDYRIHPLADVHAYLGPRRLFETELAAVRRLFDSARGPGSVMVYIVSTAGLGTDGGESAIREYLRRIDDLAEYLVYTRRGRATITITSDHGHNLVPGQRVVFDRYLRDRGWRPVKSLGDERDVVIIDYGLVTFAALFTPSPAALAGDLACHPAVDLAMHPQADGSVVVLKAPAGEGAPAQRAIIRRADGAGGEAYAYHAEHGDPLAMLPVIEQLRGQGLLGQDGFIDADVLFAATARHEYPDALRRVWRAFSRELVANPADVLLSLKEEFHHGSPFFEFFEDRASTHGSLRRLNSEAFVLSTHRNLPPLIRLEHIMPALGISWPRSSAAGR